MKFFYTLIFLSINWAVFAQQMSFNSQYMLNDAVLNPAIAGSKEYFATRITHRNQWMGIKGAPVMQTIGFNCMLPKTSIGLGGFIFNEMLGPTRKTGLQTDYSYHLELGSFNLSMGIRAGLFQYRINLNEITTNEGNDPVINNMNENIIIPDAAIGAYLYNSSAFFGISAPQLLQSRIKFNSAVNREEVGKFFRHYIAYGGYIFNVNKDFQIEPSFLVKTVLPAPISYDFNLKCYFNHTFWAGASYRNKDALVLLLGVTLNEEWRFGYSFDLTTSNLRGYTLGSHEIMLGYDYYSKKFKFRRKTVKSKSVKRKK